MSVFCQLIIIKPVYKVNFYVIILVFQFYVLTYIYPVIALLPSKIQN